jgi:predicted RNA-binding Zn ribbon-like protein
LTDAGSLPLVAGHLALDFANTAGWHASDHRLEHLGNYRALLDWSTHAGAISAPEARRVAREAGREPRAAARTMEKAIGYREAVYHAFAAIARGHEPAVADLALIHGARVAALRASVPEWHRGSGMALEWPAGRDLARPLHPIMIAAGELLASGSFDRLKQCGNHPCGWLFLDQSKNGTRRWCSSSECGNAARVRRFRKRNG